MYPSKPSGGGAHRPSPRTRLVPLSVTEAVPSVDDPTSFSLVTPTRVPALPPYDRAPLRAPYPNAAGQRRQELHRQLFDKLKGTSR